MKPGIINLYTTFSNYGGAQNVAFNLHLNLFPKKNNFLMGLTSFDKINEKYPKVDNNIYLNFTIKNVIKYKNYIFISHHRKITTYLILLNKVLFLNLRIIHVSHNEFFSLKYFSLFPEEIIAVSDKVKKNLIKYFKLKNEKINVIYNGLEDKLRRKTIKQYDISNIKILYPARINKVKQQVKIVERLRHRLKNNITIDFAGEGEDKDKLNNICKDTTQFSFIGFVNINEIIEQYDFVMLFTQNEGLPLSLIEACMFQKPTLANDVGGNFEILENALNGIKLSSFEALGDELNKLQALSNEDYVKMASNARKTYESKFTIDKMHSKYRKIIQENRVS